jgi:hypothetical protein
VCRDLMGRQPMLWLLVQHARQQRLEILHGQDRRSEVTRACCHM